MPRFPTPAPAIGAIPSTVYSPLAHRLARHPGETWPFHVGDTWREPPEGARMRTIDLPGVHRYPPVAGVPELVRALVARAEERHAVPTTAANVLVAGGATAALSAVAMAFVAPGDEVLILAPYWPLVAGIVRCVQGVPVPVRYTAVPGGPPDEATLRGALQAALGPRTVAVYLNTPNNPTGRVFPPAVVRAIVAFAREHDLWVWADDVYEDLRWAGDHVPARGLAPERTFSLHSFSKQAGMAGNRVGWVVGPDGALDEVRKAALYSFYSAPTASQHAALRTLSDEGRAWIASACAEYRDTGSRVAELLGVEPPESGTFLFVDAAAALDDRGLPGLLEDLVADGVLVAPGPSFGPFPTAIRICFTAVPPEATLRGAARIARRLGR